MRTRWSTAMRSGVPVGMVRAIVAGAARSTAAAGCSSVEEGGAHKETSASSRGASPHPETFSASAGAGSPCAESGADWPSATEAQNSNVSGRHGEIRARYITLSSAYLLDLGRVPALASEEV